MSPQEFGDFFWDEVKRHLRILLEPRFTDSPNAFDVDGVLPLCRRQLELEELSPWRLAEVVAQRSGDPEALRQYAEQQGEPIAERVAGERYVEDCVLVGRFRGTKDEVERRQIRDHYWVAFTDWTYGDAEWGAHTRRRCGGVLGARLIAELGLREAENQFAAAKDKLDQKVFAIERFNECARAYRPQNGMKFENFFKRLICFRAGDVVREIGRSRFPREFPDIDPDSILGSGFPDSEQPHRDDQEAAHRNCLEAYRQAQKDVDSATRKIAAYELRYKAYLDPQSQVTRQTLDLVADQHQQLCDEYFQCQQELRSLEDQLNDAESACSKAWEGYQAARRRLDTERCSPGEWVAIERKASVQNKTEMETELTRLGGAERQSKTALTLQYMIAYKALAQARRKRANSWKEWVKWEECRLPWVRPQETIAQWLAASQPMINRHIAEVKQAMRVCLGLGEESQTE